MLSVDSFLIRDVLTLPSKARRIDSIAGTEGSYPQDSAGEPVNPEA
jgi:hypothetical protein